MNIGSICTRRMVAVDSGSSLVQAASLMREHHVGALIVTSRAPEGACVTGIVTDRDLVVDVLARGLDGNGIKVGELASDKLASLSQDADVPAAIAVMEARGVRRALVTDSDGRVVGILSLDDLISACAKELAGLASIVRSGIQREVTETTHVAQTSKPLPLRVPAMGTAGWTTALVPH
ncbi:CBS domain-containing protein [Variovorax humicola]|uniref:CBS domain-containing protein n=1 Tax=Variovorax humicola TaxID=1769758 RepID=A0ABU8WBL9_9BURK